MDEIDSLKHKLTTLFSTAVGVGQSQVVPAGVVVVKRNRELKKGEFEVRLPRSKSTSYSLTQLQQEEANIQVELCSVDSTRIFVHCDRSAIFRKVVSEVVQQGGQYGRVECSGEVCCVNCVLDPEEDSFGVGNLRSLLLYEHIVSLLTANGYDVQKQISTNTSPGVLQAAEFLKLNHIPLSTNEREEEEAFDNTQYFDKLLQSKWRDVELEDQAVASQTCISLSQFQQDSASCLDSKNYSSNVKHLHVCLEDEFFVKACRLAQISTAHQVNQFIHVVPCRQQIKLQQADLLSRVLSESTTVHSHVVHRGVSAMGGSPGQPSMDSYFKCRLKETEEAFKARHGIESVVCDDTVTKLVQASVRLEILKPSINHPVKLELNETSGSDERHKSSPGVFILYNFARLAMMLSKFEELIAKGYYEKIPDDLSQLDFSLLREEEEWTLLFNYVMMYPSVVKGTIDRSSKSLNIHSHKICMFLMDLTRDFSSYYSRVHVLSEPRKHLMPTMHVRLVLLKAVHVLFQSAFKLLNISPLPQM